MAFDFSTLITDRSPEDLQALRDLLATPMADWTAEQLAQFNQAVSKGAYNYTDLNRVTACMDCLNERLTALGYQTGYERVQVPHQGGGGSVLPEGYTQLEYIQSSGNAWINTGVSGAFSAVFDVQFASSQTRVLMGQSTGVGMYWGKDANNRPELGGGIYLNADLTQRTEIKFEKTASYAILSAGGQSVQRASSTSTSAFLIFRAGGSDAGSYLGTITLFHAEFYTGDQLIREFIPCKEPSGAVGLYDLVSAQFYGNDGTGTFIPGPTPVSLPDGYTQVEYIQSSGTQYIDTGFKPNQDTRIVMDVYVQTQASFPKIIFGGRNGDTSSVDSFVFLAMTSTTFRTDYGNPTLSIAVTPSGRFAIDKNKNVTVLNGTNYTQNNATFQSGYNLAIFSLLGPGGVDVRMCSMKLYSCQLYDNGTLIRDYVPCTDPSAAVGLYDLVGGVFYGNAGTGVFTAGPEIPPEPEPEPTLDPYTWYEIDVPTASAMVAYLANVAALRGVLTLPNNTAAVPADMDGLTVDEANAIEEILLVIEDYLTALQKIFLRSGMAWAVSGGPGFYFKN